MRILILIITTLFFLQCTDTTKNGDTASTELTTSDNRFEATTEKIKSKHSVDDTANKLQKALMDKGMNVFTTIKHHSGAEAVGLDLRPTMTIIFGNPKVGTKLMQCSQTSGIDQPMKALIWEDEAGDVWLAYNSVEYLTKRHGTAECAAEVVPKIENALANFAQAATE